MWILLGEWINEAELRSVEYDPPLTFVRERIFDCILLTVHYTKNTEYRFIITTIDDLDEVFVFGTCYPVAIVMSTCSHISTTNLKYIQQYTILLIKYIAIRMLGNSENP